MTSFSPKSALGASIIVAACLCAAAASVLAPYDPTQTSLFALDPPSAAHWLGTDELGRDILSRILFGARISLGVGIGAAIVATILGVPIGLCAGYLGGKTDLLAVQVIDLFIALPGLVLALIITAMVGPSIRNLILILGFVMWPAVARMVRGQTFAVRESLFVEAARAVGAHSGWIIRRHVWPNVLHVVAAQFAVTIAFAIFTSSSLSFLGLGVPPPTPDWGGMVRTGFDYLIVNPAMSLGPGTAVALTVAGFYLLGTRESSATMPMLEVQDLSVSFRTPAGLLSAVRNVSFEIAAGEVVALVGESGSGKSTLGLAIMGLLEEESGADVSGGIWLVGKSGARQDLTALPERTMRDIRGSDVAMIFQEPLSSLNPIYTIGGQICEAIRIHRRVARGEAQRDAIEALTALGVPDPVACMSHYPHQLSGGMRQRVMIAMALACHPTLLIADEPTTALDATIQAQIVDHLRRVQASTGMAILFITHNLGLVGEIADRALVMYAGEIVETGPVEAVFRSPHMPYTRGLLDSLPRIGRTRRQGRRLAAIPGAVPSLLQRPAGCAFHPRCGHRVAGVCDAGTPPLEACAVDRRVRCFRWREVAP